jgi:glucose-6-phosphate isomerase
MAPPSLGSFGAWAEQLIAESTGKNGKALIPLEGEPLGAPEVYGQDRFFVNLRLGSASGAPDAALASLTQAGHPLADIALRQPEQIAQEFVRFEIATAVAGAILGINPFDQPDVESAKIAARGLLDARPEPTAPAFVVDGVEVRVSDPALAATGTIAGVLDALWASVPADGYVSIQAYVDRLRLPQLHGLRELVAADSGRPTTFGWGPRFLHSTGQYHKGGPAHGVFLQILEQTDVDLEIPGRPFTFGQLIQAQAAGDASVLADGHGRPVVTLTLTDPQVEVLTLFEAAQ